MDIRREKESPKSQDKKQDDVFQEQKQKPTLTWLHWLMLVFITMIGPYTQDFYMPLVPTMIIDFDTTAEKMAWVLLANIGVNAIFSLILPYQSDIFGRKPILYFCFIMLIVGTIICCCSQTLLQLIIGRCIQGVGETCMIIPDAIIRDLVDDPAERVKKMGIIQSLVPIGLVAAPPLGGLVGNLWGWRINFGIILVVQLLLFIGVVFKLEETVQYSKKNDGITYTVFQKSRKILCSWWFMGPSIHMVLIFQCIYIFLTTNTYIIQNYYGLNVVYNGVILGVIGGCGIVGASIAIVISMRMRKNYDYDLVRPVQHGIIFMTFPLILFIVSICGAYKLHIFCFIIPLMIFVASQFFFMPFVTSIMTEKFKDISGFVNGIAGCLKGLIPIMLTDYVNAKFDDDYSPFWPFIFMFIVTFIMQCWFIVWKNKISFKKMEEEELMVRLEMTK